MKNIILNGKNTTVSSETVFEAVSSIYSDFDIFNGAVVVILNGFQIPTDHQLNDGDIVTVIKKGELPNEQQLEIMMAARHTPGVHAKVKNATVAIAGLGGLGSNIAAMLARIGVGHLILIDFDVVEPSNLNRQNYYVSHLGLPKTVATEQILTQINPFIKITTKTEKIEKENILELIGDAQIVVEAFDKADYKAMLVSSLLEHSPDKYIVAGSGMAGYHSSNLIKTNKKFGRLYLCGDGINEARPGEGLMAPRVNVCAGHEANMVLRLILGETEV